MSIPVPELYIISRPLSSSSFLLSEFLYLRCVHLLHLRFPLSLQPTNIFYPLYLWSPYHCVYFLSLLYLRGLFSFYQYHLFCVPRYHFLRPLFGGSRPCFLYFLYYTPRLSSIICINHNWFYYNFCSLHHLQYLALVGHFNFHKFLLCHAHNIFLYLWLSLVLIKKWAVHKAVEVNSLSVLYPLCIV